MNSAAPTPVGGPIADGHYVLMTTTYYNEPGSCQVPAGGNTPFNLDFTATVQSPALHLQQTCPSTTLGVDWKYDAPQTSLTLYQPSGQNGMRVDVFARQ